MWSHHGESVFTVSCKDTLNWSAFIITCVTIFFLPVIIEQLSWFLSYWAFAVNLTCTFYWWHIAIFSKFPDFLLSVLHIFTAVRADFDNEVWFIGFRHNTYGVLKTSLRHRRHTMPGVNSWWVNCRTNLQRQLFFNITFNFSECCIVWIGFCFMEWLHFCLQILLLDTCQPCGSLSAVGCIHRWLI